LVIRFQRTCGIFPNNVEFSMQFCLPRHVRFVSLATVVLAMGITGCGETKQIPVTGKIILDGKQLKVEEGETAAVNFYGTGDAKSFGVGVVSEDGTYTVSSRSNKTGVTCRLVQGDCQLLQAQGC
jgi:hypothetical protein